MAKGGKNGKTIFSFKFQWALIKQRGRFLKGNKICIFRRSKGVIYLLGEM